MAHGQIILAIGGGTGTLSEMAMAWSKCRPIMAFAGDGWAGKVAGVRLDERRKDKVVRITNKRDLAKQLKQFLRKA
jgi:predicted Rossmann-fold nucleotide-binding protein